MRLAKRLAGGLEFLRVLGIELEHVVVARDDRIRADGLGQVGCLAAPQVAGDPPLGAAAVDRQQRNVDFPLPQVRLHPVVRDGVAAMVNRPRAKLGHVADELMTSEIVPGQLLVRRRDGVQLNRAKCNRLPGVDGLELVGIDVQAIGGECVVGRRHEQLHLRVGLHEGDQCFAVKMVGVIVAGGGEVDEIQRIR